MAKKPSKTAIGAFVVGAIVLLIGGLLFLGAGQFFTKRFTFITFFDRSVKGLAVGSPVMFRGVKVGSVTDIRIMLDPTGHALRIPVVFTLEPGKFEGTPPEMQRDPKMVETIVKKYGLRTQLQLMSLLTGQLMIALDFFPDKPAHYVGVNKRYPEIPSVPTPLEEIQKTFENLPFREMVQKLTNTLEGINRVIGSVDAKKAGESLEAAIHDVRVLVRDIHLRIGPLMESLTKTSGAAQSTLAQTDETLATARGGIKEILAATQGTLGSAQAALKQSEQTLRSFSGDSSMAGEVNKTLQEISATARSLRQLSDYLERHPESLLRGKGSTKGE